MKLIQACAVAAACLLSGCGGSDSSSPPPAATIATLSNRADLVSGGTALAEIVLPQGGNRSSLKVERGGADITAAFAAARSDARIIGLVTGLVNGDNAIVVRSADSSFSPAQLNITNHPIGGPVLVSTQIQPMVCATPVPVAQSGNTPASNASGLSTVATDAQCNIATEYKLWYRTTTPATAVSGDQGCSFVVPDPTPTAAVPAPTTPAASCFQPYVPGVTPAAAVATTTTSQGITMPYIVRVERGTINRGIYDIAVLFDPSRTWTATAPQPQWNGKVLYGYGPSTGQPRQQFRSEQNWVNGYLPGIWDDTALRLGFIVADNSMTDSLYNSNRVVTAETTMMMKEHIIDTYGEVKYAMGIGCSGGSIGQNTTAALYPGLLDGIQPSCDFSDSITTAIEISDCVLLLNLYTTPEWGALESGLTSGQVEAKKTAIEGHRDSASCRAWFNAVPSTRLKAGNFVAQTVNAVTGVITPIGALQNNCLLPPALVYDLLTNPNGVRCGEADAVASVFGTVTAAGVQRARTTVDNTGVQYGLKALLSGVLTPEEFVVLNERVGGYDADFNLASTRWSADTDALAIAYKTGYVANGKNLGKVAIIDSRGNDEQGIHLTWRSFAERARLDRDAGNHDNQVLFRFGQAAVPFTPAQWQHVTTKSFLTMDAWLTSLMSSAPKAFVNDPHSQSQVVAAKPSGAVDQCFLTGDSDYANPVFDIARCDADSRLTYFASPRQAAGGAQTEDVLKCQLKPINFADYPGIVFTSSQQSRLSAVFSTGVCDWSRPGIGQQDPVGTFTFKDGPGGIVLPPAPVSRAL